MRNMWLMIITMCIVNTYETLYSLALFIWANDNCYVYDNAGLNSLNTIAARFIQYILWMYPVFWLFWPAELSCCSKKNAQAKAPKSD